MGVEIFIVDNDPMLCSLSSELLREIGFTTQEIHDGNSALEALREYQPRAVLLDILMPGLDGLSLCRTIKSDPVLKEVKVLIVSAKSFAAEKERALKLGADLFIEKPYQVKDFVNRVTEVVGPPQNPRAATHVSGTPSTPALTLHVWGHRSLSPGRSSPPPEDPHTPCVSIESPNHTFIFDAGSGLQMLGTELLAKASRKDLWLFLTHFHPAHLCGLGAFPCTREEGINLHICGPNDPDKTLEGAVREAFQASFAHDPEPIQASIRLFALEEGVFELVPGVRLAAFYTNHPTTTLGFRLETSSRTIVYCPDSELYGESATALQDYDEVLSKFCREADLLIHDARYKTEDYPLHKNEGHCHVANATQFAASVEARRLILFHQDASYTPEDLDAMQAQAREILKAQGSTLHCEVARPGLEIQL